MDEYIKREAAKRLFANSHDYGLARKLNEIPAADVAPVVHGHWEEVESGWDDLAYRCSVCGDEWLLTAGTPEDHNMKYCQNCGAKMDQED